MKDGLICGLLAGMLVGAVVATKYKPAREIIEKGSDVIMKQTKKTATQNKKNSNKEKTQID